MSENLHSVPYRTGVMAGQETTPGEVTDTFDVVLGRNVRFTESVTQNKARKYDPNYGGRMVEVTDQLKVVNGDLTFEVTNWKFLTWFLGNQVIQKIIIEGSTNPFAIADVLTKAGDTVFTATVTAVSGQTITVSTVTNGTIAKGDTISKTGDVTVTGVVDSFDLNINLGNSGQSFSLQQQYSELDKAENFLGLKINELSFNGVRGEPIEVSASCMALDELTITSGLAPLSYDAGNTWIWTAGSIIIDGVDYKNVIVSASPTITRNMSQRGIDDGIHQAVIEGILGCEVTIEMDLSTDLIRNLRRNNNRFDSTIVFTNKTGQSATLNLINCWVETDPREINVDNPTITTNALISFSDITVDLNSEVATI